MKKLLKGIWMTLEGAFAILQLILLYMIYQDASVAYLGWMLPTLINGGLFLYIIGNMYYPIKLNMQPSRQQALLTLYTVFGMILLFWYSYYTPIDYANTTYSPKLHAFYVTDDIVTIVYLFGIMCYNYYILGLLQPILDRLTNIARFIIAKTKWTQS